MRWNMTLICCVRWRVWCGRISYISSVIFLSQPHRGIKLATGRCEVFTVYRRSDNIFKKEKTCLMLPINHKIVFILKVSNLYNCGQGYLYKYILYSYSTRFFLFFLMFWLINWCSFYFKPRSGSDILTGSKGGLLVPLSRPRCWQHCCKKFQHDKWAVI